MPKLQSDVEDMTSGLKKVQASLRDLSERTKEDMADERGTVSLGGSEEREEIIKSYVKCSTSEVFFYCFAIFKPKCLPTQVDRDIGDFLGGADLG